jgi:hypothetical protein
MKFSIILRRGVACASARGWWSSYALLPGIASAVVVAVAATGFELLEVSRLQPLPFPDSDRLAAIRNTDQLGNRYLVSIGEFREIQRGCTAFSVVGASRASAGLVRFGKAARQVAIREVSADYFSVLNVRPTIGAVDLAVSRGQHPSIVLSFGLWRQVLGGQTSAVGQIVSVDAAAYTVAGVMPREFRDSVEALTHADPEMVWVLGRFDERERTNRDLSVVGRLKSTERISEAAAQVSTVANFLNPGPGSGVRLAMTPLKSVLLDGQPADWLCFFAFVVTLSGYVGLFALILQLLRHGRRDEAPRSVELLYLAAPALAGGLVTAALAIAALRGAGATFIPRLHGMNVDAKVVLFACGTAAACALVAFAAAVVAAGLTSSSESNTAAYPSASVIGIKLHAAMSMVWLTGALVAGDALRGDSAARLGFNPAELFTFRTVALGPMSPGEHISALRRLSGGLAADSTFSLVALASNPPLHANRMISAEVQPAGAGAFVKAGSVRCRFVSRSYFETLGIKIISGNTFAADGVPLAEAVVSESFTRRHLRGDPLRWRLKVPGLGGVPILGDIVGVATDTGDLASTRPDQPEIYLPYADAPFIVPAVLVRSHSPLGAMRAAVGKATSTWTPGLGSTEIQSLRAIAEAPLTRPKFMARWFGLLAAASLTFLAVGIRGVRSEGALLHSTARHGGIAEAITMGLAAGSVLVYLAQRALAELVRSPNIPPASYVYAALLLFAAAFASTLSRSSVNTHLEGSPAPRR